MRTTQVILAAVLAGLAAAPASAAVESQAAEAAATFESSARSTTRELRSAPAPKTGPAAPADVRLRDHRGWNPPGRGGPFPRDPRPFPGDGWPFPGPGDRNPDPGRGYGRQPLECSATDRGWEEHWGGHISHGYDLYASRDSACRSCKKPTGPHGDCDVRCAAPEILCSYEFVADDNGAVQDSGQGEPRETSYDAEDAATSRCMRNNWGRPGRCRIRSCERQDRTLLWDRCR